MKDSPLISIVIPVYNSEIYLGACLYSIINQTYTNLDIVLVNDGSTDQSASICDYFAKKDKRIRVFNQLNQGFARACYAGYVQSKGKYIAFVDSDDWIEEDMVSMLYRLIREFNADIATCPHYIEKDFDYEISSHVDRVKDFNRRKALCELYEDQVIRNCLHDKLFKKELFDNLKATEGSIFEITEVLCKALFRIGRMVMYPDPLYHYRVHSMSTTARQDELVREYYSFVNMDYLHKFLYNKGLLIKKSPKSLPKGLHILGQLGKNCNDPEIQSIRHDVMKRLDYYQQLPVNEVGVWNALLLKMALLKKTEV